MLAFIDYLETENIIRNLRGFYKTNETNYEENNIFDKIIDKVKNFESINKNGETQTIINFTSIDLDIFGSLYEDILTHKRKKNLGEFFTPISIVNYILDAIEYNNFHEIENKKIIDISCGSGSFIIQIIIRLIDKYLKIYNKEKISELSIIEAKNIVLNVRKNIYGIDINRIACILCQINIHFVLFEIFKHISLSDKDYHLPCFNIINSNALFQTNSRKYDYVIGNPPYLFIRDIPDEQKKIIENGNFKTSNGQYDYYQIFMEIGLKILKNQGFFGYIVPDSLLALSNRSIIRKYIYNHTKIREIYHTGPKFNDAIVSNIILILQKEDNPIVRNENWIRLQHSTQQNQMIQQATFKKWNYKFLVHLNDTDISIIKPLNDNFQTLNDLIKGKEFEVILSRGVELSKSGEIIQCKLCRKFFPLPKKQLKCPECNSTLKEEDKDRIIYDSIPHNAKVDYKLFLYSINRYQRNPYKYIDTSKIGINYKNLENYEDRIIIRQISQNKMICATYDISLSLTSQSFYNLKVNRSPIPEFNNYYLLGIINSTLLSYYFIKSFGSYKKLFPRILIEKIKEFPIKIPFTSKEKEKAKEIIDYVKISLENFESIEINQRKIDLLIFDLYQISDKKKKYIWKFMKNLDN